MKTQFPRKHDDKKTTATVESPKDTESSMSIQPILSLCSSSDLKLPSTPKFMAPSQGISRVTSMSPGGGRKTPSISLGEVNEPIDKWISKAMERIESTLGDIKADTIEDEDSDDSRFNFSLVERLQEQANKSGAHERSMTELPKLLQNPKKTAAKLKQSPKETQKETTAKKKSHIRAISELRPKHYNLIQRKGKPRHKRDNDSEVPLDIMKAQSELIQCLSNQNSSKENTRRSSKLLSDADLPQARTPEDDVKTVGEPRKKSEMSSANQKKESEVISALLLKNPKKTEAKSKQRPKETQKETTAKMKSHLRAISELRPKHYNLIEKKGKPRHKRDNDSEVPLDIVKAQSELIHSLSDQNSSKENTRRLSKLLSDADLPQAQTPEDGVKTVGDNRKKSEMSSANQKKESEAFRSFLLTINEFKSKIQEKDVEIEKEEKSLAELGGGPHLKQQVEELRIQLQEEPTSPEIQKANERNRVLTRERDEHLALTGDLIKENVELREKIRQRNEQLSKLSAIIQNHASQRA